MRFWLLLFLAPLVANAGVYETPVEARLIDDMVNVRSGPGEQYPILWTFHRNGWPVNLIADFSHWYKIRDIEGEEGWIYKGLVSKTPTAIISAGEPALLYRGSQGTKPSHRLAPTVVVALDENGCNGNLCKIEVLQTGSKGWLAANRLLRP